MSTTKLSERARPGSECAPWVHAEIVKLESLVIDPDKLKRTQCAREAVRLNAQAAPAAPQPAQQPLTDEQIFDSWEFITGHQIQFGPRNEGRAMFISTDEVLEFARAVEKAHGVGQE